MDNMTYSLAKQLKEVGFPGSEYWLESEMKEGLLDGSDLVSLSALIEACEKDDRFFNLGINPFEDRKSDEKWVATGYGLGTERSVRFNVGGSTPEEAVANLWLELNKK